MTQEASRKQKEGNQKVNKRKVEFKLRWAALDNWERRKETLGVDKGWSTTNQKPSNVPPQNEKV